MRMYMGCFLHVMKKDFILLAVCFVLWILTFPVWAGVPFFIIGSATAGLTANLAVAHFCVSLSGGFLFSLAWTPINVGVARQMDEIGQGGFVRSFMKIEAIWMIGSALAFEAVYMTVIRLYG